MSIFDFNILSSISKNDRIFESCTSFIIISLVTSDPFLNFDVTSSAYCIQTQFAQPDIQQLVGGGGIYRKHWKLSWWALLLSFVSFHFTGYFFIFNWIVIPFHLMMYNEPEIVRNHVVLLCHHLNHSKSCRCREKFVCSVNSLYLMYHSAIHSCRFSLEYEKKNKEEKKGISIDRSICNMFPVINNEQ